jgi:hypothetical protein
VDVGWILILFASMGLDSDGGTTARLKSEHLSLPGSPGPILMDYLASAGLLMASSNRLTGRRRST